MLRRNSFREHSRGRGLIVSQQSSTPFAARLAVVVVPVCFFATGVAGLIYEVVWNRTLSLLMGNTSYALATLLTVFMAGLALGAWIGGRIARGGAWGLRLYGLLELAIGLYCLILPTLIGLTHTWFAAIYRNHYGSLVRFNLMQFVVVGLLLLLPTTAMGATLPILTRFLVRRLQLMSRTVGVLYAVNSGGAFVGVMLAGLVLLPSLGVRSGYTVAIVINLVVGLVALGISFAVPAQGVPAEGVEAEVRPRAKRRRESAASRPSIGTATLLVGFGVSGFAAMVYQIAWTRAVALAIGSSTYAFTLIAGAFILGLTLGSVALGWMGDRSWGPKALAALPWVIALSALSTVSFLGTLPIRVTRVVHGAESFAGQQWAEFAHVFGIFVLPTFCMGGMLPIVSRYLATGSDDAGRAVGNAYASNAVGTILGSFCGGFVLIPWIGMRASILTGSVLSGLVGAVFLFRALAPGTARVVIPVSAMAVVLVFAATSPTWEASVITSGPFLRANRYARGGTDEGIRARMQANIVYYEAGVSTVVTVVENGTRRSMIVGGKPDAFSYASTQNWIAQLPLLLRPEARRVLIIGLGSGHTLSSVEAHPNVESIDVVEMSAEVVEAARDYFGEFTGNALDDPRVNLIVGDGRVHLEHTAHKYDVIISQPSNPWISGAASLFTREAFAAMRRRLEPGGIVSIWFQGFRMPLVNFRTLSRTWGEVWEHPSIWNSRIRGEYVLLGSDVPLEIEFDALKASFVQPRVLKQMTSIRMPSPAHALGYLVTADGGVRAVGGDAPINTDDSSRIEFDTPKALGRDEVGEIYLALDDESVDPWGYVRPGGGVETDEYLEARELGARIFSDQREIRRSINLPTDEAIRILESINARNPYDAVAARELNARRRQNR